MENRGGIRSLLVILGVGFAILYALQACTPLRLCTDAILHLQMAASATDGHGFPHTLFPIGYPAIVSGLETLGLATSAGLVCVNLAAMAAALMSFFWIFTRRLLFSIEIAATICLMSAASWVYIKHVTLPLSDMPYLGASAIAVLLMAMSETRSGAQKAVFLLGAAICCAFAISIRTVGIALIPALIWAVSGRDTLAWLAKRPRLAVGSAIVFVAAAIIGCYEITHTLYFRLIPSAAQDSGIVGMIGENIAGRLRDLGQIAVNAPLPKLPESARAPFSIIGAVVLSVFALGLWSRGKAVGATEIYLLSYTAILFAWPFEEPRYWVPVFPLLAAFVWLGGLRIAGMGRASRTCLKLVLCGQLAVFFLLAAVAMAYSTRITFAGNQFPERFGAGSFVDTYRAAFGQPFDQEKVNPEALQVIKRYGGRLGR